MLAFAEYVNRYVFSLAREHVLPVVLARTNRHDCPWLASLGLSVTGLVVIAVYAVAGWDPLVRLFFWVGTTGGYGILLLLAATSVAVIVFFARDRRGENLAVRVLAPGTAALLLAAMAWEATSNYATLLGVPGGSPEARLLPAAYLAIVAAGVILALVLRSHRPDVYAGIGAGHLVSATPLRPWSPMPAPGGLYGTQAGGR